MPTDYTYFCHLNLHTLVNTRPDCQGTSTHHQHKPHNTHESPQSLYPKKPTHHASHHSIQGYLIKLHTQSTASPLPQPGPQQRNQTWPRHPVTMCAHASMQTQKGMHATDTTSPHQKTNARKTTTVRQPRDRISLSKTRENREWERRDVLDGWIQVRQGICIQPYDSVRNAMKPVWVTFYPTGETNER